MVRMLGIDLRKLFGDYHIYVCMAGLGILYLIVYLQISDGNNYNDSSVVNVFSVILEGSEVLLLSFLLCIVGGSFLYCAEEKYGYMLIEIQRVGVSIFTISKLITSFLGGFLTVIVGNGIFLAGVMLHRFLIIGTLSFEGEDIETMVWLWLFSALRCGVLSAIGFLVTTYVTNYYIGMTTPLLMYYGILQIQYWISYFFPFFPYEFYFTRIYGGSYAFETNQQRFLFALLYTVCIFVLMYRIAKKRIERRLEHG